MSKGMTTFLTTLLTCIFLMVCLTSVDAALPKRIDIHTADLSLEKRADIEALVTAAMQDSNIPGMAIVIVENDQTVLMEGFGYADIATQQPVTNETLFEIGSTSKAFTALGILQLEAAGLIHRDAPIQTYLPWFHMRYVETEEGPVAAITPDITIEQLLHHTSGIPFETIGNIPIASDPDALERTVAGLVGQELTAYPGDRFLYATINYDVLGLIIQVVSGMPFEVYMQTHVLDPLGLEQTFVAPHLTASPQMATGYKLGFLQPRPFDAPEYRGNAPAGYFVTNAQDLATWLKIQLRTETSAGPYPQLIEQSHQPNRTVPPDIDGSSYAAGWHVYQDGAGQFSHGGSNPNFSSHFIFRPADELGIGVLANLNSSYTDTIAHGVLDILQDDVPDTASNDLYQSIDRTSSALLLLSSIFSFVTFGFIAVASGELVAGKRTFIGIWSRAAVVVLLLLFFLSYFAYCLYSLPGILFSDLPWDFIVIWSPYSLMPALISLCIAVTLFCVYILIIMLFPKNNDKSLYHIVMLSFISGIGNAIVIFAISESLKNVYNIQMDMFLYFILGLLLFIFGQKIIKTQMTRITNNIVYNKRVEISEKLLSVPFEDFERFENGKIHACLSGDTDTVSRAPNTLISMLTDSITLICCFIYLGILNIYGLLLSLAIIIVVTGLYYIIGQSVNKLMEQARDNQNIFFGFINDLLQGFKELRLNFLKRNAFIQDFKENCNDYRRKQTISSIRFIDVEIIGDLLFIIVIGVVVYAFPVVFRQIQPSILTTYVFVLLYMTGPINAMIRAVPYLFEIRISWNRINALLGEVSQLSTSINLKRAATNKLTHVRLQLEDVEYEYQNDEQTFKVGPINYQFRSGELVFLIGGNGSGKTTLAKLLTGLYKPQKGRILLNGHEIQRDELGEYFSNVFSDFHLFKKLYGIDYDQKYQEINTYLDMLQIKDKLTINTGVFSTTQLSTGQRKRLALLISYLDDRHIFLFDEWASDQDPMFRTFFYEELLPALKQRGKCVIVITHDDHYFHIADALVKLHAGQIELSSHHKGAVTLDLGMETRGS